MNQDKGIKTHILSFYFAFAIIISWLSAALATNFKIPLSPDIAESAGPLMYIAMLTGPFISGLVFTAANKGRGGIKKLLTKLTKWHVNLFWYAFALLLIPTIAFTVLLLLSNISSDFQPALLHASNPLTLIMQGILTGVFVGFFEEVGWTGFAVPKLLQKHGLLKTGLLVGVVWGFWHFIPFWEIDSFKNPLSFVLLLIRLFSWLIPFRILLVWIYTKTNSLLLPILMHASAVFTTLTLPSMDLAGTNLIIWILAWTIALWIAVGGIYYHYLKEAF